MTTINNEGDQPNCDGFAACESKSGPALLVICTLIRNEQDGWKCDSPATRSQIVSLAGVCLLPRIPNPRYNADPRISRTQHHVRYRYVACSSENNQAIRIEMHDEITLPKMCNISAKVKRASPAARSTYDMTDDGSRNRPYQPEEAYTEGSPGDGV
jgi:hypothetical protein